MDDQLKTLTANNSFVVNGSVGFDEANVSSSGNQAYPPKATSKTKRNLSGMLDRESRGEGQSAMVRALPDLIAGVVSLSPANWWDEINQSVKWQDGIFYSLSGAFALVSAVALIQLIRIEVRVPEFGWTTQKVFHLMNFIVNGVRAIVFGFHKQVFLFHPKARSLPTDKLRLFYISINAGIYVIQGGIWVYLWINDNSAIEFIGKIFIAVVSLIAALGFLLYGGRLFFMLRRFPIESKGRRKKLHEVVLSAFDSDASLDVLDHPVLNLIYYVVGDISSLRPLIVGPIVNRIPTGSSDVGAQSSDFPTTEEANKKTSDGGGLGLPVAAISCP
nr:Tobamovirus multiplication protein 1 [Ipomoea batatas]